MRTDGMLRSLLRFLFGIPSPWRVDSVAVGGNARDMTKAVHVNLVNSETPALVPTV